MKRTDLTALGIETKETIDAIMKLYGDDINDIKAQIVEKDKSIEELTAKVKDLSFGGDEIESLKRKVEEYQNAEKKRKDDEEKAIAEKAFLENFDSVVGEKKFTNDYTKSGIAAEVKAEMEKAENKNLGMKDVFEKVTKDRTDIWSNPNQAVVIKKSGVKDTSNVKAYMDERYKGNPFYKG